MKRITLALLIFVVTFPAVSPFAFAQTEPTLTPGENEMVAATPQTGYADVNELHMYYEIHGAGEPLVVLHGAYMSIPALGEIVPRLAATRQVIAVEAQGHGRTADIADRLLSYEQMADDVAALMSEIDIQKADIFGYSMGAVTALQIAIRHPERVRKLVVPTTGRHTRLASSRW